MLVGVGVARAEGEDEIFSAVATLVCLCSLEAVGVMFLLKEHPLAMMTISMTGIESLCSLIGGPLTCR